MDVGVVDRPDRGVGVGVGGQQHPLRVGVELAGGGEELRAAHPGHALVDEQQGDRVLAQPQPAEQVERLVARRTP